MAKECPKICPDYLAPICGEAKVNGKTKICKFNNDCEMELNGCKGKISK